MLALIQNIGMETPPLWVVDTTTVYVINVNAGSWILRMNIAVLSLTDRGSSHLCFVPRVLCLLRQCC